MLVGDEKHNYLCQGWGRNNLDDYLIIGTVKS